MNKKIKINYLNESTIDLQFDTWIFILDMAY